MSLVEKPFLIGVLGTIASVVLVFLWVQTRRKQSLVALAVVIALTAVGIMTAAFVETDREAVERALNQAADAVERNDLPGVLKLIHSQGSTIRSQAAAEFPRFEFHEVKIKSNLEITFDRPEQPTEATAKFNVVVSGSERNGLIKNWRVPRYCIVTFRKEEGEWRVAAYQHDDPREGLLDKKRQ